MKAQSLAQSLAGLVLYGEAAPELVAFYRDRLGIALAPATHGKVKEHHEGQIGSTHMAVWPGAARFVPVFRVDSAARAATELADSPCRQLHPVLELGEGKRIVSFTDPAGNEFRLIEIAVG